MDPISKDERVEVLRKTAEALLRSKPTYLKSFPKAGAGTAHIQDVIVEALISGIGSYLHTVGSSQAVFEALGKNNSDIQNRGYIGYSDDIASAVDGLFKALANAANKPGK